jgi:flagellar assembly factor FliW
VSVTALGPLTVVGKTPIPELYFAEGLPGFPDSRRFALVQWGDEGPFSVMVDLDDDYVRFLVVPPGVFYSDYDIELDDWVAAKLGLVDPDDALVLVIVTLDGDVRTATANLLGPIVVNHHTRQAVQAVLSDRRYGTRVPLVIPTASSPEGS